jgi:hypothetical protein
LDPQQVISRATGHFQPCFPASRPVSRPVFASKLASESRQKKNAAAKKICLIFFAAADLEYTRIFFAAAKMQLQKKAAKKIISPPDLEYTPVYSKSGGEIMHVDSLHFQQGRRG